MAAKRGRPVRMGMRRWLNDETYGARIDFIIGERDKTDDETVTDVTYSLLALAKETIPADVLTECRLNCVRRLARHATPSVITRTLLSWRLGLEDRVLRQIQQRQDLKDIAELCWA